MVVVIMERSYWAFIEANTSLQSIKIIFNCCSDKCEISYRASPILYLGYLSRAFEILPELNRAGDHANARRLHVSCSNGYSATRAAKILLTNAALANIRKQARSDA